MFGFAQAQPRALSDVTHSGSGPEWISDVYQLICPAWVFGIPKRVKRLVQLEFQHKGLFGTPGGFSVTFALPKGHSRCFEAYGEGVGLGPPTHVHACLTRGNCSR